VNFSTLKASGAGGRYPKELRGRRWLYSLRQGRWKYIAAKPGGGSGQLYDLDADPRETRDLAAENLPIAAALATLLDKYRSQGFSRTMRGKGPGFP